MPRIIPIENKGGFTNRQQTVDVRIYCPICVQVRPLSQATRLLALQASFIELYQGTVGKQTADDWAVQAALAGRLTWACDVCLASGRAIGAKPWLQVPSLANPDFAFSDKTLRCSDCDKDFVFAAKEQQYWYETLQFNRYSQPKQCIQCRRKRRIYKRFFHDLERSLAALDPTNADQLANVAEGYLQIENLTKALEFFQRARRKAGSGAVKAELAQRIREVQDQISAPGVTVASAPERPMPREAA